MEYERQKLRKPVAAIQKTKLRVSSPVRTFSCENICMPAGMQSAASTTMLCYCIHVCLCTCVRACVRALVCELHSQSKDQCLRRRSAGTRSSCCPDYSCCNSSLDTVYLSSSRQAHVHAHRSMRAHKHARAHKLVIVPHHDSPHTQNDGSCAPYRTQAL
jgi:hypothetical protein